MRKAEVTIYDRFTVLETDTERILYVLPHNLEVLRTEPFNFAFVFVRRGESKAMPWRKVGKADRDCIEVRDVRRPALYMQGYAVAVPSNSKHKVEREELLFIDKDDRVQRLYGFSIGGKTFVPPAMERHALLEPSAEQIAEASQRILIDVMSIPIDPVQRQMQLGI